MRLIAQVQHLPLQQRLVTAWKTLDKDDVDVLAREMALTGCAGQQYACLGEPGLGKTGLGNTGVGNTGVGNTGVGNTRGGPVFLVYYSPAFLRMASRTDIAAGLHMLAEIYRQARTLWPFAEGKEHEHVTVRVDQIKEHSPQHVMDGHLWGEGWLLVKHNEREAIVEHHPLYTLNQSNNMQFRVLAFWHRENETQDFISELDDLRKQRMGAGVQRV
jgi:hypothetical protein